MPSILALGKQGQVELCEFEAYLVKGVSSRTARAAERDPVSGSKTKEPQTLKHKKPQGSITFGVTVLCELYC